MSEELKNVIRVALTTAEQDMLNDYITNLQEENDRLKKQEKVSSDMSKEYYMKNKKAIEYLEYQISQLDFEKDIKAKMLGSMVLILLEGE